MLVSCFNKMLVIFVILILNLKVIPSCPGGGKSRLVDSKSSGYDGNGNGEQTEDPHSMNAALGNGRQPSPMSGGGGRPPWVGPPGGGPPMGVPPGGWPPRGGPPGGGPPGGGRPGGRPPWPPRPPGLTTPAPKCVPSCGNIRRIQIKTGSREGDQLSYYGKLSLTICSNETANTCCDIGHLRNKGKEDFLLNKVDTFENIEGLRNCHNFHLPYLEKLRISMTDGTWRGQFLKLSLDNGTTIDCPIESKLQHQGAIRLEFGCKFVHVSG